MKRLWTVCALTAGLAFFGDTARSQFAAAPASPEQIRSASGQFVVTADAFKPWYYRPPEIGTNHDIIRLDAPLLAVSAERFKSALWQQIGLPPSSRWTGKIFLALHPARSLNEEVFIGPYPFGQIWNYRVNFPDLISRNRFARTMSAVLLLEIANRNTPVSRPSAVLPAWLADGLARQVIGADGAQVVLSAPAKTVNGLPMTRLDETRHGIDPLAAARRTLQNTPALTFEQLSWPDNAQMNGADGGVYLASAQLFVTRLLDLPDGPARLRDLLVRLPACENWQTAFYAAFRDSFQRPLDVEKWWSLQVVNFAHRDPGPRWTSALGRQRLDALLLVPVDIRYHANAWPVRAEISLQAALREVAPDPLAGILQTKMRDLDLVQLRLSPSLAGLAAGYRAAIADYLGEKKSSSLFGWLHHRKASAAATIEKLNALDQQRQKIESDLMRQEVKTPGS